MNLLAKSGPGTDNARTIWLDLIEQAIAAAEASELELSRQGGSDAFQQRKDSGSYYTPADVAAHFWDLFFRHHRIQDLSSLLAFVSSHDFIEPSAGSGMFVFSFLKKAAQLGASPECLANLSFHVVDINLAALRFFSEQIQKIETSLGVSFKKIGLVQNDFLKWCETTSIQNAIFVGNPPFVSNKRGARWRNLYADFLELMLSYRGVKGISLVVPLSVCFSRDYTELRALIRRAGMGVSSSSYDNIPDSLFKTGKPDSKNTNRANSQRCTILNIGGPNPVLREASPLLSWSAAERESLLTAIPIFRPYSDEDPSEQIPRPATGMLVDYLRMSAGAQPLRMFLSKIGKPAFAVGGVARNYIGIRDYDASAPGCIPIKISSPDMHSLVLQIISSNVFFDYWRTYGDGFHVTVDLIERFPVSDKLTKLCKRNKALAQRVWANREAFAKEKLNSGRLIRSYDFRAAFDYIDAEII